MSSGQRRHGAHKRPHLFARLSEAVAPSRRGAHVAPRSYRWVRTAAFSTALGLAAVTAGLRLIPDAAVNVEDTRSEASEQEPGTPATLTDTADTTLLPASQPGAPTRVVNAAYTPPPSEDSTVPATSPDAPVAVGSGSAASAPAAPVRPPAPSPQPTPPPAPQPTPPPAPAPDPEPVPEPEPVPTTAPSGPLTTLVDTVTGALLPQPSSDEPEAPLPPD